MANFSDKRPNPAAKAPEPKAVEKQPEAPKAEEPVLVATGGDSVAPVQAAPPAAPAPEATIVAVEPVVALPESSEEKLVVVTPRETIPSTRIGGKYYSFLKGTAVKVPLSVKLLLQEKGIL